MSRFDAVSQRQRAVYSTLAVAQKEAQKGKVVGMALNRRPLERTRRYEVVGRVLVLLGICAGSFIAAYFAGLGTPRLGSGWGFAICATLFAAGVTLCAYFGPRKNADGVEAAGRAGVCLLIFIGSGVLGNAFAVVWLRLHQQMPTGGIHSAYSTGWGIALLGASIAGYYLFVKSPRELRD
jgi:hypothetical protein